MSPRLTAVRTMESRHAGPSADVESIRLCLDERQISPASTSGPHPPTSNEESTLASPGPEANERIENAYDQTDRVEDARDQTDVVEIVHDRASPEGKPSQGKKHRRSPVSAIQSLKDWCPEMISLAICLAALVGIIAVAASQDGKPLRNIIGPLTLNAMVAILTSILKAALLMPVAQAISELKWVWFATGSRVLGDIGEFDLASRGPRGSLRFLFRFPHNKLACLGAVITLLSLGTDTLTQLVVQTYDCLDNQAGAASLNRTNNYTAYDSQSSSSPNYILDSAMYFALFQGILSPPVNDSSSLPHTCASGYCQFPNNGIYSSLGLCSSVANITDKIVFNSQYDLQIANSMVNLTYHVWTFSVAEINLTGSVFTAHTPLFEFEALGLYGPLTTDYYAYTASIFPCIYSFKTTQVVGSQVQQTLLSKTSLPRIASDTLPTYFSLAGKISAFPGTDCSPAPNPQGDKVVPAYQLGDGRYYIVSLQDLPYVTNVSDAGVYGSKPGSQGEVFFDPTCTWTFGTGATTAIQRTLEQIFGTQQNPQIVSWSEITSNEYLEPFWIRLLESATSTNTVSSYMEGLVNSMTAAVRRNGDASNSAALQGALQVVKRCVCIRWGYLVWDLVLFMAAVIFSAATLFQTSRAARSEPAERARGPWKSSALALVWCPLSGLGEADRARVNTKEEIEELSRKLVVRLDDQSTLQPSGGVGISAGLATTAGLHVHGNAGVHSNAITGSDAVEAHEEDSLADAEVDEWVLAKQGILAHPQKRRVRNYGSNVANYLPL